VKKLLLLFVSLIVYGCSNAQNFTPPSTIPPYKILNTDSVNITPASLKKNKPVMIIYFSPDCGHCQHLMNEMKPYFEKLKGVQVVMITFVIQLRAIQDFYKTYGLKNYPNFIVGTEGYPYAMQKFYQIKTTPYIAIYNKYGVLDKTFEKAPSMNDLMTEIKKL